MLRQNHHLILLLLPLLVCVSSKGWVVVKLANGGTSPPLLIGPLGHDHQDQPMPEALPLNAPSPSSQPDDTGPVENDEEAHESGGKNDDKTEEENGMTQDDGIIGDDLINVTQANLTSTSTTSTSTTSTTTSTTTTTTTSTTTSTSTKTAITTEDQPQTTQTTSTKQPVQACHLSCLEALNSTHLTPNDTLTLSAGSSLTLECQIPLVPELILEDMLWLFHPGGTPEGQCSLTPHRYLPSCPGFSLLSETDDRNETFLKQIVTLSNLDTNHTGDYMCQVQVTCCPGQQQHVMSQQHDTQVTVKIWWADYTLELAVTGSVAAVLLLTVLGVSAYGWRQGSKNYYHPVVEVEAPAVHHLPLIDDDQDTDSFNSSILNDQHETEDIPAH